MQINSHIFLIGFMGSGKTHWARLLSQKLDWPFLDLDELISAQVGKTIPAIFDEKGESAFRLLEQEVLQKLENHPPTIVATGGGTPCFFDNMSWMVKNGLTIYLQASPTLLIERLRKEKGVRPLISGIKEADLLGFIELKIKERELYYLQAQVILPIEQTNDTLLEQLLQVIAQA